MGEIAMLSTEEFMHSTWEATPHFEAQRIIKEIQFKRWEYGK